MAYKEIVTKAVIAKGKKKYTNTYEIAVETKPSTILGCWIINHDFKAHEVGDKIVIDGSYDANIWYSYDEDTKTMVTTKKITYQEETQLHTEVSDVINKDIIVRSLKQPTYISAKEDGNIIKLEIEKELGIEIVGDTKVRIASVEDKDDDWQELESTDSAIDKVNTNYIDKEIIK